MTMEIRKPIDIPGQPAVMRAERQRFVDLWPGLLLVLVIGLAAYGLSRLHTSLDALAMAIILGIAARIIVGKGERFMPGVRLGVKVLIPIGIILYGSNLNFNSLGEVSSNVILLTLVCMASFYVFIFILNRIWGIAPKMSELIASGSAICGASAIAVLSPEVDAKPEDTSISLLVVTTVGLMGAMIYPVLRDIIHLPDQVYAVLSGATLHQTGIVKIAVSSMSLSIVNLALGVKTIRILMLLVVALLTAVVHSRTQPGGIKIGRETLFITLRRVWFLLPFALCAILVSLPATSAFFTPLKTWATFFFAFALGSIGFMVDMESVLTVGGRPLMIGLLSWFFVVILFLLTWSWYL